MKPTVKRWNIAIIGIDVVFLIVAFDLYWLYRPVPAEPHFLRTYLVIAGQYLIGYLSLRSIAMHQKKKIALLEASTPRE